VVYNHTYLLNDGITSAAHVSILQKFLSMPKIYDYVRSGSKLHS